MPKIIPLRELNNASKVSKLAHETNEPIFITKNGVSDLVVMTSEKYDMLSNNYNNYFNNDSLVAEPSLFEYVKDRDSKKLYSIVEIKQTLEPIFKKYKVKKATLFGSYVKGTADTRSDIDLMVETDLKGLKFYGLLGEISDSLRFPVDLFDSREVKKGTDFEKEIKTTGVTIYG